MNIIWHEKTQQFHLYNDEISYIMYVQPNGELAQKINELGLQFGFWIEPEMVNPDSDFYRTSLLTMRYIYRKTISLRQKA